MGAFTGWYPYPFLNATTLGYPTVALVGLGVAVLIFAVAGLVMLGDRKLSSGRYDSEASSR